MEFRIVLKGRMKRIAQKKIATRWTSLSAHFKINVLKIGFHVMMMMIIMKDMIKTNACFERIVTQNVLKRKDTSSVHIQVVQDQKQNGWMTTALV